MENLTYSQHVRKTYKFNLKVKDKLNVILKFFNLDLIISVGYRVKSQRGIVFIRWAKST